MKLLQKWLQGVSSKSVHSFISTKKYRMIKVKEKDLEWRMSLNSKLQKQGKVRKSCCLKTFHESHFVMVLFCIALLKCGSKEVLYHCTTLKKLSMPETLDLSYKQSISAPKKTVCKLNMMLCLLQEGTISTLITLYDIGTSVKSKQ